MGVLGAGQAQALVVTVSGQQWDVTTFTGTYNNNVAKFNLANMPWLNDSLFDSSALMAQFVVAVNDDLGAPNVCPANCAGGQVGTRGPYFAQKLYWGSGNVNGNASFWDVGGAQRQGTGGLGSDQVLTFAQATPFTSPAPVPGPRPALGAAAAFGFSRKLRKRINVSKAVDGSSATAG